MAYILHKTWGGQLKLHDTLTPMKLVIATPLYPPDIALPALYVKELARRLASDDEVVIVAYTRLPESVPGVRIRAISKRYALGIRLLRFFFVLLAEAMNADAIYAENGASVELPVGLVSLLTGRPLIMHIGDRAARERAAGHPVLRSLEKFALSRARSVITDIPLPRPIVVSFLPRPATEEYERSWQQHMDRVARTLYV